MKTNNNKKQETLSSSQDIFLARQAIFDADINVFAYELLFRNSEQNRAEVKDANQATSTLIMNSFVDIGLENITNNKLAFINLTRDYLTGEIPIPFPANHVVLEVLEDIHADKETIAGLATLSEKGYTIALDDFIVNENNRDLIPLADIIKIDILSLSEDELREEVESLKTFPIKLLAEKVETRSQFSLCKELGFDYFQGYFFCRPTMITGKKLPVNNISLLEIISKLQDDECNFNEIDTLISNDVALSYKLLKIINSPFYGQVTRVNSINQALKVIGIDTLKNWVIVLGLTMIDDKPAELVKLALIRAKMCESLAIHFKYNQQSAFTVGLFSLLDVLMDQELNVLVKELPLADDILDALLESKGELGILLTLVTIYESGDWGDFPETIQLPSDMNSLYIKAVSWADELGKV